MQHESLTLTEEQDISPLKTRAGSNRVKKEKKVYMELIRALCMVLVIFNHTGSRGYFLFYVANDSVFYPFYMFISVACKVAVPLYWMISGALLLPKDESIKQVYLHRVLRMVLVLLVFSVPYYINDVIKNHQQFGLVSVFTFFVKLYVGQLATAFSFIYAYIGMMLILPLLRKLVRVMPKSYFKYLFLLVLGFRGVLPLLEYLISTLPSQMGFAFNADLRIGTLNPNIAGFLFPQTVLFFLGGYYFDSLLEDREITKKGAAKWLGAGFLAIVLTCLITHYRIACVGISQEADAETFFSSLILIPTFAVFYSMRLLFREHPVTGVTKKVILSFGRCAFGIMLCEEALRHALDFIYSALAPSIRVLPACLIWVAAVYLGGYVITLCLKRIPGIRALI